MLRTLVDFVSIQALEARDSQATATRLLAYDIGLPDLNLLLDSVDSSYKLLPIDPNDDAIKAIGAEVALYNFQELAILCHGSSGNLNIGSDQINIDQIISRENELKSWNLNSISMYCCEAGSDFNFLQTLSNIMSTHVFASTQKVGSESQGGSWNLDVHASPSKLFATNNPNWEHTLGAGDPIEVDNGDDVTAHGNWDGTNNIIFKAGEFTGSYIKSVKNSGTSGNLVGTAITAINGSALDIIDGEAALTSTPSHFNSTISAGTAEAADISSINSVNGTGTINGSSLSAINGTAAAVVQALADLNTDPTNFNSTLTGTATATDISSINGANNLGNIYGSALTAINGTYAQIAQALTDLTTDPTHFNSTLSAGTETAANIALLAAANGTGTIKG